MMEHDWADEKAASVYAAMVEHCRTKDGLEDLEFIDFIAAALRDEREACAIAFLCQARDITREMAHAIRTRTDQGQ